MLRTALSLAFAIAVGLSAATLVPATADAKKPMNKLCLAKDSAGKKVSFKCSATEKCCWQPAINKGSCVAAPGVCI